MASELISRSTVQSLLEAAGRAARNREWPFGTLSPEHLAALGCGSDAAPTDPGIYGRNGRPFEMLASSLSVLA